VFDLLKKHRGETLTLATIPKKDTKTFDDICRADTIGVFQIESRAQMSMLPRLRPRTYYDLVIQVSIVRPGPISGGMVHPYLRRRNHEEKVTYPHPSLKPVLGRTLGVPLFQEQVMRLAIVGAGYTPGQADQLRRDMAAWKRNGKLEGHHSRIVEGMVKRGIEREFAERVFQQIRGFGEYGFPESHAASFALISYAGAYLKTHYPSEFLCGILNSLPMGFYSASTLIEDSKRHGVEVRPIDVTKSEWLCTLETVGNGYAVRMGMRFVKGLSEPMSAQVREARERSTIEGLSRSGVDERSLRLLAEAGALDPLEKSRRAALWKARGADAMPLALDEPEQLSFTELTPGQQVSWDYERSSHSTRGHPVAAHREELRGRGWLNSDEVKTRKHNDYARVAGAVIGRQRPATASGVVFMTLEDETGMTNLVVWRDVFDQFMTIIRTRSFLGVEGRVQFQDGVLHVIAERFFDPLGPESALPIGSRDFH
jgi:error-prone DNA polymerase